MRETTLAMRSSLLELGSRHTGVDETMFKFFYNEKNQK
jgi:hypothetical protein